MDSTTVSRVNYISAISIHIADDTADIAYIKYFTAITTNRFLGKAVICRITICSACAGYIIFFIYDSCDIGIFRTADNAAHITGVIIIASCSIFSYGSSNITAVFCVADRSIFGTADDTACVGNFDLNSCNVCNFVIFFRISIIFHILICCMVIIVIICRTISLHWTLIGNILHNHFFSIVSIVISYISGNAAHIITAGNIQLVVDNKSIFAVITYSRSISTANNTAYIKGSVAARNRTQVIGFTGNGAAGNIAGNTANIRACTCNSTCVDKFVQYRIFGIANQTTNIFAAGYVCRIDNIADSTVICIAYRRTGIFSACNRTGIKSKVTDDSAIDITK